MSDEKKLPDEAVKDVSGGGNDEFALHVTEQASPKFAEFRQNNCKGCGKFNTVGCPYYDIRVAFVELRGADCPDRG